MYLLYADESGDEKNTSEEHFVLAGISIFERQVHWLSQQLDALETTIFGPPPAANEPTAFLRPIEFHAAAIQARKKAPWDSLSPADTQRILDEIAALISGCHDTCTLFAIVVHKASFPNEDPVEIAFGELARRFDLYLRRLHAQGETQRGLMVFDKSRHESRLQTLLRAYTKTGGRFGRVVNFSDVPFFADSRASRMLQIADFIAWATFRRYERKLTKHFDPIISRFDHDNGRIHGLNHKTEAIATCYCPACMSRRA